MSVLLSFFVLSVSQWIILNRVITATVEYKFVNESLSWNNAVTYCDIVLKGSLADDSITLLPVVNESSSNFWIGRYSAYTNWTWITGCFRNSILQDARVISIRYNSVVNCHSNCNTTYVALVGTSCYCLPARPDDINGSRSCDNVCNGNNKELCGGKDAVSVYQKDIGGSSNFETVPNEGNQSCGSIRGTENSVRYFQRNCVEELQYGCKIYTSDNNGFTIIPFRPYSGWDLSNNFCRTYNGSLADIQSAAQFSNYFKENLNGDLWIGLYRVNNTFTIQERLPDISSIITCSYYNQGQMIEKISRECQSERKSFFCRIERKLESITESSVSSSKPGAIAGIIIGILIIITAIIIAVIVVYRFKRQRNILGTPELSDMPPNDNNTSRNESTYAQANVVDDPHLYTTLTRLD